MTARRPALWRSRGKATRQLSRVAIGGIIEPVEPPDVEYARSGDLSIAYQVLGDGSPDLIYVDVISH